MFLTFDFISYPMIPYLENNFEATYIFSFTRVGLQIKLCPTFLNAHNFVNQNQEAVLVLRPPSGPQTCGRC